jgi:hypothetical protein
MVDGESNCDTPTLYYKGVTSVLQGCYKGVTSVLHQGRESVRTVVEIGAGENNLSFGCGVGVAMKDPFECSASSVTSICSRSNYVCQCA